MAAKSNTKSEAETLKPSGPSRETLEQAAKLRAEGATWNTIREATGTKLGSSSWFRAWEREGIDHIPAGQRVKPKSDKPATPAAEAAAKPKRTVRRSAAKK